MMDAERKNVSHVLPQSIITESMKPNHSICSNTESCLDWRRYAFAGLRDKTNCTNCLKGREREDGVAATRPNMCGRCDKLLTNPEANFCTYPAPGEMRSCQTHDIINNIDNYLEYFSFPDGEGPRNTAVDGCPRGHLMTGANGVPNSMGKRCKICSQIKTIITAQARAGNIRLTPER